MSRPEKMAEAIHLRGRGHAWSFIGDKVDTPIWTVRRWCSTPEALQQMAAVARETAPSAEQAATIAGDYLLDVVTGEEQAAEVPDRIRAASVLMANRQRMIEVAAKAKEADAATSQAKTADELATLEAEAQAYLADARKRQGER